MFISIYTIKGIIDHESKIEILKYTFKFFQAFEQGNRNIQS